MHDLYRRPGLIEGIMMRGPQKTAVAVRLPDKTIETEYLEIKTLRDKYPLFRAPLLRGIAGFIDSLSIGYRALMLSAENPMRNRRGGDE